MKKRLKKEWFGTYHPKYGKMEDKEYEVDKNDVDWEMWASVKREGNK